MEQAMINEMKESNKKFFEKINQVEGFYPEAELVAYKDNKDAGRVIERIPLSVKEIWFKAVYPEGVIRHQVVRQDKELVIVTCYLYRDYRDDVNQFLRSETVAIAPEQSVRRDPSKGEDYFSIFTEGEIIQKTVNSAKARSENYCLSKAGFGCQYETSYREEEESLDDLEKKADKELDQPAPPAAIPGTPKKNGVLGDVKEIINADVEKDSKVNGFIPSKSDREPHMPQKSILDYKKESEKVVKKTAEPEKEESISLDKAYAFKPSDSKFNTLHEILKDNPDRLLYMAKRTTGEEKAAIMTIINHDERLSAMAKRIGIA